MFYLQTVAQAAANKGSSLVLATASRVLRRYVRNQELRREKRVLEEKLRLFNEHLQDKAKQQPAASKQQAGNKQQQSRANAAAAPAAAPAAKKAKVA